MECWLHRRGRNPDTIRKPRSEIAKMFDRTWYGGEPINTTEKHLRVRAAWLAVLYEAGWTEREWEADSIPMEGRRLEEYRVGGRARA